MKKLKICIIGAENWGSALATAVGENVTHSSRYHNNVHLYVLEELINNKTLPQVINETHENIKYLPGIHLPDNVIAVSDLLRAARNADVLIFAMPQQFTRSYCNVLSGKIKSNAIAVSLIKGLERKNYGEIDLYSHVISKQLGIPCYSLLNPKCAMEMAQGKLCEVTIGCNHERHARILREIFETHNCKVMVVNDVEAVELCHALKDIVALGAGLVDGLRLGENARVAMLHLGMKEMIRFMKNFYPSTKLSTFFESCCMADLVSSCYGDKNVKFAKTFVTSGKTIQELELNTLNGRKLLGPLTAEEINSFLNKGNKEDMFPLFTIIHKICQNEEPPDSIIDAMREHPDLSQLTISKLLSSELSNQKIIRKRVDRRQLDNRQLASNTMISKDIEFVADTSSMLEETFLFNASNADTELQLIQELMAEEPMQIDKTVNLAKHISQPTPINKKEPATDDMGPEDSSLLGQPKRKHYDIWIKDMPSTAMHLPMRSSNFEDIYDEPYIDQQHLDKLFVHSKNDEYDISDMDAQDEEEAERLADNEWLDECSSLKVNKPNEQTQFGYDPISPRQYEDHQNTALTTLACLHDGQHGNYPKGFGLVKLLETYACGMSNPPDKSIQSKPEGVDKPIHPNDKIKSDGKLTSKKQSLSKKKPHRVKDNKKTEQKERTVMTTVKPFEFTPNPIPPVDAIGKEYPPSNKAMANVLIDFKFDQIKDNNPLLVMRLKDFDGCNDIDMNEETLIKDSEKINEALEERMTPQKLIRNVIEDDHIKASQESGDEAIPPPKVEKEKPSLMVLYPKEESDSLEEDEKLDDKHRLFKSNRQSVQLNFYFKRKQKPTAVEIIDSGTNENSNPKIIDSGAQQNSNKRNMIILYDKDDDFEYSTAHNSKNQHFNEIQMKEDINDDFLREESEQKELSEHSFEENTEHQLKDAQKLLTDSEDGLDKNLTYKKELPNFERKFAKKRVGGSLEIGMQEVNLEPFIAFNSGRSLSSISATFDSDSVETKNDENVEEDIVKWNSLEKITESEKEFNEEFKDLDFMRKIKESHIEESEVLEPDSRIENDLKDIEVSLIEQDGEEKAIGTALKDMEDGKKQYMENEDKVFLSSEILIKNESKNLCISSDEEANAFSDYKKELASGQFELEGEDETEKLYDLKKFKENSYNTEWDDNDTKSNNKFSRFTDHELQGANVSQFEPDGENWSLLLKSPLSHSDKAVEQADSDFKEIQMDTEADLYVRSKETEFLFDSDSMDENKNSEARTDSKMLLDKEAIFDDEYIKLNLSENEEIERSLDFKPIADYEKDKPAEGQFEALDAWNASDENWSTIKTMEDPELTYMEEPREYNLKGNKLKDVTELKYSDILFDDSEESIEDNQKIQELELFTNDNIVQMKHDGTSRVSTEKLDKGSKSFFNKAPKDDKPKPRKEDKDKDDGSWKIYKKLQEIDDVSDASKDLEKSETAKIKEIRPDNSELEEALKSDKEKALLKELEELEAETNETSDTDKKGSKLSSLSDSELEITARDGQTEDTVLDLDFNSTKLSLADDFETDKEEAMLENIDKENHKKRMLKNTNTEKLNRLMQHARETEAYKNKPKSGTELEGIKNSNIEEKLAHRNEIEEFDEIDEQDDMVYTVVSHKAPKNKSDKETALFETASSLDTEVESPRSLEKDEALEQEFLHASNVKSSDKTKLKKQKEFLEDLLKLDDSSISQYNDYKVMEKNDDSAYEVDTSRPHVVIYKNRDMNEPSIVELFEGDHKKPLKFLVSENDKVAKIFKCDDGPLSVPDFLISSAEEEQLRLINLMDKTETEARKKLASKSKNVAKTSESNEKKKALGSDITRKLQKIMAYKPRKLRKSKEITSNIGYGANSPYLGEPKLPFFQGQSSALDRLERTSQLQKEREAGGKRIVVKPPFHPPLNPLVRVPRPPFDGRDHEYHTMTQLCSHSNKPINSDPLRTPWHRCKPLMHILRLTRATKIFCAINIGVFTALMTKYIKK